MCGPRPSPFSFISALNHSCTFLTERNVWITVNMRKEKNSGGILRNGCVGSHDKILIWTFSETIIQLMKCYANHMQMAHNACIYSPRLVFVCFSPPLPRIWSSGNPSRNNRALITLLSQCCGWNIRCAGDDNSEAGFWSVCGTYVHERAHWSPTMSTLNPNAKKNLYTNMF